MVGTAYILTNGCHGYFLRTEDWTQERVVVFFIQTLAMGCYHQQEMLWLKALNTFLRVVCTQPELGQVRSIRNMINISVQNNSLPILEPRLRVWSSIQALTADVKHVNIFPLQLGCVIVHSRQSAHTTGLFSELHGNPLSEKKHINNNIPRQHSYTAGRQTDCSC